MTKNEFYRNLQSSNIAWFNTYNEYYIHQYILMHKDKKSRLKTPYSDSQVRLLKNCIRDGYESVSYKKACQMYDFIVSTGLEFDFIDHYFVIYYPEVTLENNNHKIYDLYMGFNPFMTVDSGTEVIGFRTTYTVKEMTVGYCHPHVIYEGNIDKSIGEFSSVCFGSTPFYIGDDYEINFYTFILYLNRFVTHESNGRPYKATSSLYDNKRKFDISMASFKFINWELFDMKFVTDNGQILLEPIVNIDEHTNEFCRIYGDDILQHGINNQYTTETLYNKVIEIYNNSYNFYPFKFKGRELRRKLIITYEKTISSNWLSAFIKKSAVYLTTKYLEAFSDNFSECTVSSEVSVSENIL